MSISVDASIKDGTTSTGTSFQTGAGNTISSAGVNRVLVAVITICAATAQTVSSVTDLAGLTWTLRKRLQVNDGSAVQTMEIWWAPAAAQVTSDRITVNYGSSNTLAVDVFAVAGLTNINSPWDVNGSLPASNSNTGAGSSPSVSGVSTTAVGTIIFWAAQTRQAATITVPSGFTNPTGANNQEPGAGSNRSYLNVGYKLIGAPVSSATYTGGPSCTPWGAVVDAMAGGVPAPPATFTGTVIN